MIYDIIKFKRFLLKKLKWSFWGPKSGGLLAPMLGIAGQPNVFVYLSGPLADPANAAVLPGTIPFELEVQGLNGFMQDAGLSSA